MLFSLIFVEQSGSTVMMSLIFMEQSSSMVMGWDRRFLYTLGSA